MGVDFDDFDISSFQDFVPGKPKKGPTPKPEPSLPTPQQEHKADVPSTLPASTIAPNESSSTVVGSGTTFETEGLFLQLNLSCLSVRSSYIFQ